MRRLALAVAALLLLTGCNLSLEIGVDVDDDGSGTVRATVTLDKDAAARLAATGGRLEAGDLRDAGWTVTGPSGVTGGGARLVATKRFANPSELPAVIDEVAGARRPLRNFRLERERSFARTELRFSGVVDLTGGLESFGDDRLREQTGADLGIDVAELERQVDATMDRFFDIRVLVRLPGDVQSNAPTDAGNGAAWRPALGERVALAASSTALDLRRLVAVAVAVTAALILVVVLLRRRRQARL